MCKIKENLAITNGTLQLSLRKITQWNTHLPPRNMHVWGSFFVRVKFVGLEQKYQIRSFFSKEHR